VRSAAYSPLDGLVDLACRDGVDVRPTLLRVLTDLYVQRPAHSAEEETQYVELALGLIDTVDDATRKAVAARLAAYPAAPAAVAARLGQPAATAPAPREPPASPPPAAGDDLATIFFGASPEERRLILTHLDLATGPTAAPLLPVARVTLQEIETAVFQRKNAEVVSLLHRALGIDQETAVRIVQDESGEPMVVAAKTLGMPAPMLQRVLLFLNPAVGQSVRRVYDLADLFDTLSPAAAGRMLAIWRGARPSAEPRARPASKPAAKPVHAPVLHDDETQGARARATPGAQRAARPREDAPLRVRDRR
jgi:hypothetical protein